MINPLQKNDLRTLRRKRRYFRSDFYLFIKTLIFIYFYFLSKIFSVFSVFSVLTINTSFLALEKLCFLSVISLYFSVCSLFCLLLWSSFFHLRRFTEKNTEILRRFIVVFDPCSPEVFSSVRSFDFSKTFRPHTLVKILLCL